MQTRYRRSFRLVSLAAALAAGCGSGTVPPDAGGAADDVVTTDVPAGDAPRGDVPVDVGPLTCIPGTHCGNDCFPDDAPCHACGTLTYDSRCACRPQSSFCPAATGCDNPAPAGVGEFCGTYSWCNRPCAAGLTCTGIPPRSGMMGNIGDYRRVCEGTRDAGIGDGGDPRSFVPPDTTTPARPCGTMTCGVGQACINDCSGIDAGGRDLHRCVDLPIGCRGAPSCSCTTVCPTGQCHNTGAEVRCDLCA